MIDFEKFKASSSWSQMNPEEKLAYVEHINKEGNLEEKAALGYDWVNVWSRPEQVPFMYATDQNWDTWAYIAGRGCGKLIATNSNILTYHRGWISYGDLVVGDYIFDEQGQPTKVLALYPQTATPDLKYFRVTFSDGSYVDACGEHLWHTWTHQQRKQYTRKDRQRQVVYSPQDYPSNWATFDDGAFIRTATRNTEQLMATLKTGTRGDSNHSIPLCKPCKLPPIELPVDPYILGNWLANGNKRDGVIHCLFSDLNWLSEYVAPHYKVNPSNPKGDTGLLGTTGLSSDLNLLGVKDNKHIPDDYLTSSIEQRIALLRGFMDGDGCFEAGCMSVLYNTNIEIINGFKKILGSLGIKYTVRRKTGKINGVHYKECWVLSFVSLDINPFLNPRKADKWIKWRESKKNQLFKHRARFIASIEPIEPIDMMCITVDSPSSLYLIGNECIPTHNTRAGAELVRHLVFEVFPRFPLRIGCVTPKFSDIEAVVALGDSGVMNCLAPWEREKARFYVTSRKIVFNEGTDYESEVRFYSSDDPENLRGSQFHMVWLQMKLLLTLIQMVFYCKLPCAYV